MSEPRVDELRKLLDKQACMELVFDFARAVDRRDFEALAGLFAEDGTFTRPRTPDNVISGRQAIYEAFKSRPHQETTRHCISNVRIELQSENSATGEFYLVLYAAEKESGATPDPFGTKTDGRALVADISDHYIRTPTGWRITSRRGRIVMHT